MDSTPDHPDKPGEPGSPEPESSGAAEPISVPPPEAPADPAPEPSPYGPPPEPSPYGPPPGSTPSGPPQDPGYPGAPSYPATEWDVPPKKGPGIWAGVGTGCLGLLVGVLVLFAGLGTVGGVWGWVWPFILVPVIAGVLMFFKKWRRFATGILIISAAAWLTVIGPCVAIFSQY